MIIIGQYAGGQIFFDIFLYRASGPRMCRRSSPLTMAILLLLSCATGLVIASIHVEFYLAFANADGPIRVAPFPCQVISWHPPSQARTPRCVCSHCTRACRCCVSRRSCRTSSRHSRERVVACQGLYPPVEQVLRRRFPSRSASLSWPRKGTGACPRTTAGRTRGFRPALCLLSCLSGWLKHSPSS